MRVVSLAALVSLVALGMLWHSRWQTEELALEADAGAVSAEGQIQTGDARGARVRFSDGSSMAIAASSSVRITSRDARAPRVTLDSGQADVHVVHRDGVEWLFGAGPFSIVVKGTSFVTGWDEHDQRLTLRLTSGLVGVSGPTVAGELPVREGQVLTVSLPDRVVVLREAENSGGRRADLDPDQGKAEPEVSSDRPQASPSPPPASPPPSKARRPSRPREPKTDWAALLATGQAPRVLEEAESQGIERVLRERSARDLEVLADAARYNRRNELATRTLQVARERFSDTPTATRAAYLLGRIEQARGDLRASLRWFDACLDEATDTDHASQCLGSKMGVVQRLYDDSRARPIAEEYLSRFPDGRYAEAARILLNR